MTVWSAVSLFIQATVCPTEIVISLGENPDEVMVTRFSVADGEATADSVEVGVWVGGVDSGRTVCLGRVKSKPAATTTTSTTMAKIAFRDIYYSYQKWL